MIAAPRDNRIGLAVGTTLVAFLLFSSLDTIAKYLVSGHLPVIQVAFTRYLVHFLFVVVVFFPRQKRAIFISNAPRIQIIRATALLSATLFNFAALVYLPLTVAIAIIFASPIGVCLLSIPILNEKVGWRRLAAVLVGFGGVVVITQIWNENFHWAVFLSVGAFLSISLYFVLTRKIAGVDNNPVSQIYASGIATLALAPFALWSWVSPSGGAEWGMLIAIGVLGAIGHSLLTVAYRFAQASTLAPMVYVQFFYVSILSWLVFNTIPDFWTVVGAGIIAISGVLIWLIETKRIR